MRLYTRLKEILNEPVYQVAVVLFFFEAAFVSPVRHFDMLTISLWCKYVCQFGIGNMYKCPDPIYNYPPLFSYLLFAFGTFLGSIGNIDRYFYLLKIFPLLADFIAAIALIILLDDRRKSVLWLLLLVANPIFIYNSYCWGQMDGILALFIFLSFSSLLYKKLVPAVFFLTLALNFKTHAFIFLPPLLLLSSNQLHEGLTLRKVFLGVGTFVVTQLCILIPFLISHATGDIWNAMINSVGYYKWIAPNADNVWVFLMGGKGMWSNDTETWLNISYRHWGLMMFCLFAFIALFPLLLSVLSKITKQSSYSIDRNSLFIIFALMPLVFFYFNTEMHERFGHTTLIFTAAFAFSTRRYWLFALVCTAYFGNMEDILHFFNFPNYSVLIFDPFWVASMYLLVIVSLIYFLYKPFILLLRMKQAGIQNEL